jgi:hypothetical protein
MDAPAPGGATQPSNAGVHLDSNCGRWAVIGIDTSAEVAFFIKLNAGGRGEVALEFLFSTRDNDMAKCTQGVLRLG